MTPQGGKLERVHASELRWHFVLSLHFPPLIFCCHHCRGKNQAFLEMETEISAAQMVEYFAKTSSPPQIRGRTIYVQQSNHRELKVSDNGSGSGMLLNSTQVALAAAQALVGLHQQHGLSPRANGEVGSGDISPTHNGLNTVLRVIIENQLYPITLEVLNSVSRKV